MKALHSYLSIRMTPAECVPTSAATVYNDITISLSDSYAQTNRQIKCVNMAGEHQLAI